MTAINTPAAAPTVTSKPTSLRAAAPALFALCLTMLVEMVDNSILNVALPTIGRDLEAGSTGLQWIVSAYSLTFGGLLMVGGTLGDRLGRRRMLLWGLVGFGLSSLLVLFVQTSTQLIAVRALSGAFAALIAPGTMSLTFRLFDDDKLRRRAIGLIVTVAMIGFAIGPVLSGLAVEHLSWHILLLANAPAAAIAWWGVRRGIAADDPADLRGGGADLLGALLSVSTIGLGLFTLSHGAEHGWTSLETLGLALLSLVALAGFIARERRAVDPMLDLALLGRPTVRGSALLQVAVTVAMVGVMFASTQIFQFAWGWSPLRAGFATLPLVAGMLLASPLVDKITDNYGNRRAALSGAALLVISLIGLVFSLDYGYVGFAAGMFVLTVGMRLVMTTCAVALIDALPEDHTSIGSALNDTAQELGNAVGVAVVGTIVTALMGAALPVGSWSPEVAGDFLHAIRIAFVVLAVIVTAIALVAARGLSPTRQN